MTKKKKPTMMEVNGAISELIKRTDYLHHELSRTNFMVQEFISFKKNTEEFTKYLQDKVKTQEQEATKEEPAKEYNLTKEQEEQLEKEQEYQDNKEWQEKQDAEVK